MPRCRRGGTGRRRGPGTPGRVADADAGADGGAEQGKWRGPVLHAGGSSACEAPCVQQGALSGRGAGESGPGCFRFRPALGCARAIGNLARAVSRGWGGDAGLRTRRQRGLPSRRSLAGGLQLLVKSFTVLRGPSLPGLP